MFNWFSNLEDSELRDRLLKLHHNSYCQTGFNEIISKNRYSMMETMHLINEGVERSGRFKREFGGKRGCLDELLDLYDWMDEYIREEWRD